MRFEEKIGWLSLGAVVLVMVFTFGMLAGSGDPQTIPVKDPYTGGPLVENGVAAVMICGNKVDRGWIGLTG
jgi:hypothetical protein